MMQKFRTEAMAEGDALRLRGRGKSIVWQTRSGDKLRAPACALLFRHQNQRGWFMGMGYVTDPMSRHRGGISMGMRILRCLWILVGG